jgi:hypothetical protein
VLIPLVVPLPPSALPIPNSSLTNASISLSSTRKLPQIPSESGSRSLLLEALDWRVNRTRTRPIRRGTVIGRERITKM